MAQCSRCGKKGMFVKINNDGLCEECQKNYYEQMKRVLTPEQNQLININENIQKKTAELNRVAGQVNERIRYLQQLDGMVQQRQSQIVNLDEQLYFEEVGLYKPQFPFTNSEQYKNALNNLRANQKQMVKSGMAVLGRTDWTVNNNAAQGKKMVTDFQKLLLRAFNSECDDIVAKVKYSNLQASIKRINTSCDAISRLGKIMGISISDYYKNSKIQEVQLAFEYAMKKQEEKEAQKIFKAQLREEAKLRKEIEAERQKLLKEETHYNNALSKLLVQLSRDPDNQDLLNKKAELESHIADTEAAIKDVDYREANKKAGYVYIISNIGAFGENIYKIGMTRRLDPTERISELSDASVPFNFDIHAMIFTDDAPKLEAALHKAFESRKVNMVNTRREFFNVSLDEIKKVVSENYDKTVEFIDYPEAEQYRMSLKMKSS